MFLEETGEHFVHFSVANHYNRTSLSNSQIKDPSRSVAHTHNNMLRIIIIQAIWHFVHIALLLCTTVTVGVVDFSEYKHYHFKVHTWHRHYPTAEKDRYLHSARKRILNFNMPYFVTDWKVTLSLLHKIHTRCTYTEILQFTHTIFCL
jgi:hypothetical protein